MSKKNSELSLSDNRKSICGDLKNSHQITASEKLYEIDRMLMPNYGNSWNRHRLVTLDVSAQSRILYYNNLYQKIVDVPGVICEFGVHWGATLAQLINLRSIYEPFNHSRHVYGFDTFEGFIATHEKDGDSSRIGDLMTLDNYENMLEKTLSLVESYAPQAHLKKFSLIKGDAAKTVDQWLIDNPHSIISMAIFDMDLYDPTKEVMQKIIPRLVKGSLLVFDELNCVYFPGETRAVDEVIGLNNLKLKRSPLQPYCAWAVYGE